MKVLIACLTVFFLFACQSEESLPSKKEETNKEQASEDYSYKITYTDEVGWGYQIFQGSKMIVDQKHIPAIQGLLGFKSKNEAESVAQHVLNKLNKGLFPPTVSKEELDSIGIQIDQ